MEKNGVWEKGKGTDEIGEECGENAGKLGKNMALGGGKEGDFCEKGSCKAFP